MRLLRSFHDPVRWARRTDGDTREPLDDSRGEAAAAGIRP